MLAFCQAAIAAQIAASAATPSTNDILATLRVEHPRLLAPASDFEKLQALTDTDPLLKQWRAKLKTEAQSLLAAPPSRYEIPDGLRLLATSRRVMNRVYTLALMHRLDGEDSWRERLWRELKAAAEFPDWNPKHFLDTAEMTHAFAIGYDWLFDTWTPEQREALKSAMVSKGLLPALAVYRGKGGWPSARHNWNQVCNGGIGMGALALGDVEPELAGEILQRAVSSLPLAMREFAPDGAWNEGPGYWNYATFYNVVFLAGLTSALGSDFGLSEIPGFSETGLFPLYITGPLGRTFNYADGGDRALYGSQIFWFARRFAQPAAAWWQRRTPSPSALDLLWYTPEAREPGAAGLPLNKHYRASEVVTLRSEWDDPNAAFVGFKAGDNKANHSHLDLGAFVYDASGTRWAVDLGADDYNMPGYFGRQRWNYYRLRAEGQNTLVISPDEGPDQDPSAAAEIVEFESEPGRAFAIADLTAARRSHVDQWRRGLALLGRRLLIQDEIKAANPVSAWWFMHTAARVEISANGRVATLAQNGTRLGAEILGDAPFTFEVLDAKPLPGSPQPEQQNVNRNYRKLAVHLKDIHECSLSILLTPEGADNGGVKLRPMAEWRTGGKR